MTRISQQGIGFPTDGGMATTRSHATPADTAARAADEREALAYLERTGNGDLAEILGLTAATPRRKSTAIRVRRVAARQCLVCNAVYQPSNARQITCSRSCGRTHAHRKPKNGESR